MSSSDVVHIPFLYPLLTLVRSTLQIPLSSLGNLEVMEIAHIRGLELVEVLQLLVNLRGKELNGRLLASKSEGDCSSSADMQVRLR